MHQLTIQFLTMEIQMGFLQQDAMQNADFCRLKQMKSKDKATLMVAPLL